MSSGRYANKQSLAARGLLHATQDDRDCGGLVGTDSGGLIFERGPVLTMSGEHAFKLIACSPRCRIAGAWWLKWSACSFVVCPSVWYRKVPPVAYDIYFRMYRQS